MTRSQWTKIAAGTAITVALGAAGAAVVRAQHGPGGPGFGHMGPFGGQGLFGPQMMGPFLAHALDLSDEQRTQVRAIFDRHKDEFKTVGDRMRQALKAQHDAVVADQPDETEIRARGAELGAAGTEVALLASRVHGEVFQILTPEQQAKAKKLREEMQQRMEERASRIRERVGGGSRGDDRRPRD
ncbi:MAG: Spy/CpxP family protein refolding chaperone [Vicinamibacterales bacterium]